jgi:hypothetical protein
MIVSSFRSRPSCRLRLFLIRFYSKFPAAGEKFCPQLRRFHRRGEITHGCLRPIAEPFRDCRRFWGLGRLAEPEGWIVAAESDSLCKTPPLIASLTAP